MICPAPDVTLPHFLAGLDDPLRAAIALIRAENSHEERETLLLEAFSKFGKRLDAKSLQLLARYARQAPGPLSPESFRNTATSAGMWFAANLLELAGDPAAAAAILTEMDDSTWGEERALRMEALARNLLKAGRIAEVWPPLRETARAATTRTSLTAADRLFADAAKQAAPPLRATRRVAVLGSGVLDFWARLLRPAMFGLGIGCELMTGEYDQYRQEILDPTSPLAKFKPEVVVLAIPWRALGLPDETDRPDELVQQILEGLKPLWTACQQRFGAAVIQLNFEVPEIDPFGRLGASSPGGRGRILRRLNLELWDAAAGAGATVLDVEQMASTTGKRVWSDPAMWIAAKQYPSPEAAPALVRGLANLIRATCGLTSKCAVLDLDGTLWGGIIGEDGLTGIRLGGDAEGEAYTAFHKYLLGLRRRGIPLAVCSKNNEEDARSVFRQHPESVLKESDFAVFFANWEPKPDNLRRIAATLNIGIDSLVFLDDNPVERNLVRKELPEVEVIELPDDPARYPEAVHSSGVFEALSLTDDDRRRAESYRDNALRNELAAGSTNVDDYLASLRMKVGLRPFDELNLPRIVQLINKTNQFNLTTRRATAADVEGWMRDPACYTQFLRLEDRFGDNGITGILVAFEEGDTLRIDNWLMSCRVLGRRMEDLMLAGAMRRARHAGLRHVTGSYTPTAKNGQVADLFDRFGFERIQEQADGSRFYRTGIPAEDKPVDWCELHDETSPATVRK